MLETRLMATTFPPKKHSPAEYGPIALGTHEQGGVMGFQGSSFNSLTSVGAEGLEPPTFAL
jgi:hypothetical protein